MLSYIFSLPKNQNTMKNTMKNTIKTLIAKRVWVETILGKFYKTELYLDGKLLATIPVEAKQPMIRRRSIIVNCWKYNLKFY